MTIHLKKSFRPLDGESFSKLHDFSEELKSDLDSRFRPLDGESFSKLKRSSICIGNSVRFRPLDGESFSKLTKNYLMRKAIAVGFRPLDGESFSKHQTHLILDILRLVSVP